MTGAVLAWLARIGIGGIVEKIAQARIEASRASTNEERIRAEERVKALEARRDVQIAEAGNGINAWVRAFLGMPVGILLWKVLVWDKALGQWTGGRTDALSPELWQVVAWVMGFYFVVEGTVSIARILRRRP